MRRVKNAQNIPAEKKTAFKRAWLPQENENRQRQKSIGEKTCKGKKTAFSVI